MSDFNGESIRKAYESRRSAVEALRAFDAGIGERALTAEEVATIGVMNADVDALDETVQRLMRDQELSERSATLDALIGVQHDAGERSEVDSLTPIEREARQLFLGRDHDEARSTAEFSAPSSEIARLARRDLTAGTASAGGNLVPTTLFGESDPAFGLVNLDAYKYGMSIQISTELEEDNAVPGMLPWILEQAVSGIRRGVGAHLVTGTGSGQPNGIDNGTTISSIAVSTTPTADQLVAIQHDIASPYRQNASWLFNDATVSAIRLLKDTTNQYIWAPGLGAGVSDTLLGAPVYTDAAVETAGVSKKVGIYGDIKAGYLVRTVANIRAERSVDYAFLNDLNTWRFLSRHDGDIIDNSAFTVIKNAAS